MRKLKELMAQNEPWRTIAFGVMSVLVVLLVANLLGGCDDVRDRYEDATGKLSSLVQSDDDDYRPRKRPRGGTAYRFGSRPNDSYRDDDDSSTPSSRFWNSIKDGD